MWQWLKNNEGIYRNPKTILRIMKKYDLLSENPSSQKMAADGPTVA